MTFSIHPRTALLITNSMKEEQHAFVQFRIQHPGYSWLYGSFKDFDGAFTFDKANPAADNVKVASNTNSLDTHHAGRDKHLRGADFLNASKHLQAAFSPTSVRQQGKDYKITGDLTLNGIIRPITLDAKLPGEEERPLGWLSVPVLKQTVKLC